MRFRFLPLLLAGSVLISSCAVVHRAWPFHKKKPVAAAPLPRPIWVGTVSLINDDSHFALVDNGDLAAPAIGTLLKTFRAGTESGELVATEVRRRPFVIADIQSGDPKKGDRVLAIPGTGRKSGGAAPDVASARAQIATPTPAPVKRSWWRVWPFGKRK